jgi:hypothetical protein
MRASGDDGLQNGGQQGAVQGPLTTSQAMSGRVRQLAECGDNHSDAAGGLRLSRDVATVALACTVLCCRLSTICAMRGRT